MKRRLKCILGYLGLLDALKFYNSICIKETQFRKDKIRRLIAAVRLLPKISLVYVPYIEDEILQEATLFKEICRKAKLNMDPSDLFFYAPDFFVLPICKRYTSQHTDEVILGNITVDYSVLLKKGLQGIEADIKDRIVGATPLEKKFLESLLVVIDGMRIYVNRVREYIANKFVDKNELVALISRVPEHPASSLKEALQVILFLNSFLWMAKHPLIGLGRLDQILYDYYQQDILRHQIDTYEVKKMLKAFVKILHRGFKYKSAALPGDTGQVIVLSGKDAKGSDVSNDLTFLFMEVMNELKLPDPKIVLRVHANTPRKTWEKTLELWSSGLGYPLLCNDDILIPSLVNFGYGEEDAYNYVVSACWEPHIQGVSSDQNNVANINLLSPLSRMLEEYDGLIENVDDLVEVYCSYLRKEAEDTFSAIKNIRFRPSPLLSLFTNCRSKDISQGGAKYNHLGVLTVGLPNAVDSLLNISRLLFEERRFNSIRDLRYMMRSRSSALYIFRQDLKNKGLKFGMDTNFVSEITNKIIRILWNEAKDYVTPMGGQIKIGLSSPLFVEAGKYTNSSIDGRDSGDPLAVHISPVYASLPYTSLFNFSSSLEYDKAFNGAVTDIVIDSGLINRYKNKFISLLQAFVKMGGCQLQSNVLSVQQLIEAKKHPENFPNLVVRVWGFSTYFRDLPPEYQDLIIERAKQYASSVSY